MKKLILLVLLFVFHTLVAQEKKDFTNPKSLFSELLTKNNLKENTALQINLADVMKKSAIISAFNPRIPSTYQTINNLNQQVSFLPGQAFGLPAGMYKEVTIGQQYVSTFSIQPQFDILNLGNLAQIKTASLSKELALNQQKIATQNLLEKVNGIYFNILTLNAQQELLITNLEIATKLVSVVSAKFNEGLIRKQDVNDAEINVINIQDKIEQAEMNLKIQYTLLSTLFEGKVVPRLTQSIWDFEKNISAKEVKNQLTVENARLNFLMTKQEMKSIYLQHLPVVSFISSYNWQNLSNDRAYGTNSNNIKFNYIGLKVSYDFPTTIQKETLKGTKLIQLKLAQLNYDHSIIENKNQNEQLVLEVEKWSKQVANLQHISSLKQENFQKYSNQYQENILPIEKLLTAQNEYITSQMNVLSAIASLGFTKTKIEIFNEY
jgi:outer membrane protein TolC